MTTWALLAPGPSASAGLAEKVADLPVGAIGCAYQLAQWASFIASSDAAWWRTYRDAFEWPVPKFCMGTAAGVERIRIDYLGTAVNSGVLGLECAVRAGATRILLLGFDMHGTHFFGPYANGLRNTQPHQRAQHLRQYEGWARMNKRVEVLNCTSGSALKCFKARELDACLAELEASGIGAENGIRQRA